MDAEVKQIDPFYRALAWAESNWRNIATGAAVLAALALVISFYLWRQTARAEAGSQALSALRPVAGPDGTPVMPSADAYLKVAEQYSGTETAARARLLAAGAYFEAGKHAEARSEFDRFLRDNPQSALRGEALYGQGACLEALNKPADALVALRGFVDRYPADPLVLRAKVALGRLYKVQNQPQEALRVLGEVTRAEQFGTLSLMAEALTEEIKAANPGLAKPAATLTNVPKVVAPAPTKVVLPAPAKVPPAKPARP